VYPESPIILPARGPLIKPARVTWERDLEMSELVEYFDEPRFHDKKIKSEADRFQLLTTKEIKVIQGIADKCRKDFSYASRNFFWITNKKRGDQLFKLWPSQELIYEHMLRLQSKGLPMKVITIKARQLGCSSLIEGLIAWKTMFFRNVNAIVVSFDPDHAAYLFGIMQHIYDLMPWWLRPQCAAREYKDGLIFENRDYDSRRMNPGLVSRVMVQAANKRTGVGQGVRISAAHISEFCDFNQDYARDVIEEDLGNALAEDDPSMFAILESTAKGTGNYAYRLWNKCVELGESAEWHPIFLPWFFEATRVTAPPKGWRPEEQEREMRNRVEIEWTFCQSCDRYQERFNKTEDVADTICQKCGIGILKPYILTDDQLFWMRRKRKNAEKDSESKKKLLQEMATTAVEAFQVSGIQVFSDSSQEWVNSTLRPPALEGFFDKSGKLHGCNPKAKRMNAATGDYYDPCYLEDCNADHEFGDEHGEMPMQIWKLPEQGQIYCIGADVAEGLGGEADYSVGFVLKVSQHGGIDEEVASFRSNTTDPIAFAHVLNYLGRWYNDALMCIEVNRYDTTASTIRFNLQYPNLYRWKHLDSLQILSNKLGWYTQSNSKPRLYQTWHKLTKQHLIVVYSRNIAEEMKTFIKDDYDERGAGSEKGSNDDHLMAAMIALYCAHEGEWDDSLGQMNFASRELTMESAPWHMSCAGCQLLWPAHSNRDDQNCPRCGSMMISGTSNRNQGSTGYQANPFEDGQIGRREAQEYHVSTDTTEEEMTEPEYTSL